MLDRTAPSIVSSDRLRALFDEAWRRTRRRRLLVAATLVAAVAVAVAVAVAQSAGDRSVPAAAPPATLALPRDPGMGVACPEPNSIACDRIGIAVWLDSAPRRLVARVGGRSVVLRDAHIRCGADASCPRLYQAMLQPAGLLDGALKVTPDEGPLARPAPRRWDADGHRHLSRRQPSRGDPARAAGPRLGLTSSARSGLPDRMTDRRTALS
jgi:hypothetical protein